MIQLPISSFLVGFLVFAATPALSAESTTATRMHICLGGGDHADTRNLQSRIEQEKELAKRLVRAHATSHETYVRWVMIEPEKGKFDFGFQDALLAVDRAAGLKWVPFLVVSPAYTLPHWFYKGSEDVGYVCLEHNERSDIQSLWSPHLRPHVERVYNAFGKHYNNSPDIESVLLGVSGNYGETLVPASNLDWTQDTHGPYHTHVGWWVGDEYAIDSFRKHAQRQFGTVQELNADWGTTFTQMKEVRTRLLHDWPTTAARQFQAEWMLDSMTEYADFCMQKAKAAMPKQDIYLVVGGHAPSYHGLDISAEVVAAVNRGCGIRITNEVDDYTHNFSLTRMVSSACRFYGTFFSYEPAGAVSWKGMASRSFNATASGARALHWYEDGVRQTTQTLEKWDKCQPFLVQREPMIDVAVFYPRRWMNLQGDEELVHMYRDFGNLRRAADYDFLDERMMWDMAGRKEQPYRWLLVREDFEEDAVSSAALTSFLSREDAPEVIRYRRGEPQGAGSEPMLRKLAMKIAPDDDFTTGIFHARFKDGSRLFLNHTGETVDLARTHPRMVRKSVAVGPYEMAEVPVE